MHPGLNLWVDWMYRRHKVVMFVQYLEGTAFIGCRTQICGVFCLPGQNLHVNPVTCVCYYVDSVNQSGVFLVMSP